MAKKFVVFGVEEALLKWERLFERAAWGIVQCGPWLSMRAVNPAYARMHGYTVEELTGRPLADTLAPEARTKLERSLKIADENGHYIWEAVHLRKDRTTFPALIAITAVKDHRGNPLPRRGNYQDATDQKRVQQRPPQTQKVEKRGRPAAGPAPHSHNLLP